MRLKDIIESDGQGQSFKRDEYPSNIYISIISHNRTATCEALWSVQGLKMFSSWFWLFSALWHVLFMGCPEQQCCVVLLSWCLQKEQWKGPCIYGGVSPAGEWETNGLVLLCTDFHGCHDTSLCPCAVHELNAGLKNLSVPRAGAQSVTIGHLQSKSHYLSCRAVCLADSVYAKFCII